MIFRRIGVVEAVLEKDQKVERLAVSVNGEKIEAVNYGDLTGPAFPGDSVILNSTALRLGLGTGGVDFVYHNNSRPLPPFEKGGHIMKLRYTPWQVKVLSCEEREAGCRNRLNRFRGLDGMPVLIGELHSMLAPAVATLKYYRPASRVAYIMTDGAALPLPFSRTVAELKEKKLIDASVTCGHAFGGDYEAINLYSALAACRALVQADITIVTMGPGNAGTGTRFGFSGMEVGEHINRVSALGGIPVVIPRISFADHRRRHRGISHHTLTALFAAAFAPARVVLPDMQNSHLRMVLQQLDRRGLRHHHRLQVVKAPPVEAIMKRLRLAPAESMGRRYRDDPVFFDAAAAAAVASLRLLKQIMAGGETVGETDGRDSFLELSLSRKDSKCAAGQGAPARRQRVFSGSGRASGSSSHPGR